MPSAQQNCFPKSKQHIMNQVPISHLNVFLSLVFPTQNLCELSKNVAKTSKLNLRPNMQLPSLAGVHFLGLS